MIIALCEGVGVEKGPEEASLEAQGGCCKIQEAEDVSLNWEQHGAKLWANSNVSLG